MGNDPTGGARLQSPTGGATLGQADKDDMGKQALKEKMGPVPTTTPKKPSDVTKDPYDDHPGMVYACEGPLDNSDSSKSGGGLAGVGTAYGLAKAEVKIPEVGPMIAGATVAGAFIGHTDWFKCIANNAYNAVIHPDAVTNFNDSSKGHFGDNAPLASD